LVLNLIELNKRASYKDGTIATGVQAYANYGKASNPIYSSVGEKIIWRGNPESIVIGPSDEHWDIAFIARYPIAGAFLGMVGNQPRLPNHRFSSASGGKRQPFNSLSRGK
jgi:hypothetical protein